MVRNKSTRVILFCCIESSNAPSSSSSYTAGNVYYSLDTPEPTQAPSSSPTVMPTLSPTSSQPTTSKPATSTPTSLIQTQSPTTKQPTLQPETSVPSRTPASNPTTMPTMNSASSKPASLKPATITPTSSFQIPSPAMTPTFQPSFVPQKSKPSIQPTRQPLSLPIFTPIDQPTAIPTSAPVVTDDSSAPDPTNSEAPSVDLSDPPSSVPTGINITNVVTKYLPRKPLQTSSSSKEQVRVYSALLVVGVVCLLVIGLLWVFPGACCCAHISMCATRRIGGAFSD